MLLIDADGNYTLKASDNTDYSLCFSGGIIGCMDERGHCLCEFDAEDAPTIQAVPVVHGRWVHCNGESNLWYCSECGEKIRYNPSRRTYNIEKRPVQEVNKYCRGCGAKMDGDADG